MTPENAPFPNTKPVTPMLIPGGVSVVFTLDPSRALVGLVYAGSTWD